MLALRSRAVVGGPRVRPQRRRVLIHGLRVRARRRDPIVGVDRRASTHGSVPPACGDHDDGRRWVLLLHAPTGGRRASSTSTCTSERSPRLGTIAGLRSSVPDVTARCSATSLLDDGDPRSPGTSPSMTATPPLPLGAVAGIAVSGHDQRTPTSTRWTRPARRASSASPPRPASTTHVVRTRCGPSDYDPEIYDLVTVSILAFSECGGVSTSTRSRARPRTSTSRFCAYDDWTWFSVSRSAAHRPRDDVPRRLRVRLYKFDGLGHWLPGRRRRSPTTTDSPTCSDSATGLPP